MPLDLDEILQALDVQLTVVDRAGEILDCAPKDCERQDLTPVVPHLGANQTFVRHLLSGSRWLRVRGAPLPHERVALMLAEVEPLRDLFLAQTVSPGLWRLDDAGRISDASDHLAEWLGTQVSALIGSSATEWMLDLEDGWRFESDFKRSDGTIYRGLVIRSKDPTPGFSWIDLIIDVTEEHRHRTRLTAEVARVSELANTDALTGLPNRRAFQEVLQSLIVAQEPFAVAMVDMDDLKVINDNFGHAAGDRSLVAVGQALRRALRESDLVARVGGDEFAVLLPRTSRQIAEHVYHRLQAVLVVDVSGVGEVTASMGMAHSDEDRYAAERTADARLYLDKRRNKELP